MNQIQKLTQAIRNCAECELDYGTLRTLKMIDDESIRMERAVVVKPTLSEVLAKIVTKSENSIEFSDSAGDLCAVIRVSDVEKILSEYLA